MATENDWSQFRVRVNINASVQQLYQAWATKKGIEHWFLRWCEYKNSDGSIKAADEPVKEGDAYKWRWYGYPDSVTEEGTILEANGKDHFSFSFGKAGRCSVTIKKEEGENIIELVQDKIPEDEKSRQYYHVGCKTGWTFHLANMKSIFEGGIDLRNRKESLKDMLNS